MNVFIGIDPSINSTGLTILKYDNNKLVNEKFFIIKPNKLTKKEEKISIKNFKYLIYNKIDISEYKDDNHKGEYCKTLNMIEISELIYKTICKNTHKDDNITISMEGISYGSSIRTKSIFDLAGLNYLIRNLIIKNGHMKLLICPPQEIKKFASGKGNSLKDILVNSFLILYPKYEIIPKLDDLVDSYYMAKYCYEIKENRMDQKINIEFMRMMNEQSGTWNKNIIIKYEKLKTSN